MNSHLHYKATQEWQPLSCRHLAFHVVSLSFLSKVLNPQMACHDIDKNADADCEVYGENPSFSNPGLDWQW